MKWLDSKSDYCREIQEKAITIIADDGDDDDKAAPVMNTRYTQVSVLGTLHLRPHTLWDSYFCHYHFKAEKMKFSQAEVLCPWLHNYHISFLRLP